MSGNEEGWAFVHYATGVTKKAHYIRKDCRTLCGRYAWLGDVEQGNDESPDNCAECKKRLRKLKEKRL